MKITVFSDYVCPFCYLGSIALKKACAGLDIDIEFHPYELRRPPQPPVDPMHDPVRLKRFDEVLLPIARQLDVAMTLPWISPHPYSTNAFQGYYFAQQYGLGERYNQLVFEAFYVHQQDIGEIGVLCTLMRKLNLDETAFQTALQQKTWMPQLDRQFQIRQEFRIQGCPSYLIHQRQVSGYHSPQQFRQLILDEAARTMTGMACGVNGCGTSEQ